MVLTHGEPHRANTINTAEGVVLIDWDTALLAPPERDLWPLIDEEPQIADDYHQRTGIAVDDTAVQLYRLRWDLCEISLYLAQFRAPHQDNHDTRVAWDGLLTHLDPRRWNTAP
jgi:thiamine kinase-like enzyme